MDLKGFYINLATSTDRAASMRRQLADLGVADRYERFDAIRGEELPEHKMSRLPAGHLGCWLSHEAVWRKGAKAKRDLHILEDDAVLSPLLVQLLPRLELDPADWDLLFTDVYFHPPPTPEQFAQLQRWLEVFKTKNEVQLVDLTKLPFTGTTSYVVNQRSFQKLLALTRDEWNTGKTLDVSLQALVRAGKLKARVTLPFLSTVSSLNLESTTGAQGPALIALNGFREALYYQADRATILARTSPLEAQVRTEPLLGLYLEVLRRVLGSVDFRA